MFPEHSAEELFSPIGDSAHGSLEPSSVFKTVAESLNKPDEQNADWAIATKATKSSLPTPLALPRRITAASGNVEPEARDLGQRLLELQKVMRLSEDEVHLLAGLAGNVVELGIRLHIDIGEDGAAHLSYEHEILNLTAKPITRIPRELWFRYTTGHLAITPVSSGKHRVAIQRVHDTPTMVKFACQVSPAIQPGETATVGYECEGGQFIDQLYWRQSIQRYTRHFTMSVRHRAVGNLNTCSAIEEHQDGSENFASEDLLWDYEDDDIVMTLTRDYLKPNQCVTLRWDVDRATS